MVQISTRTGEPAEVTTGLIAVCLYKGEGIPESLEAAVPTDSGGDFSGKSGETALLYTNGALPTPRLLLVGLGDESSFTTEKLRRAAATAARRARKLRVRDAAFVPRRPEGASVEGAARAAAEGASLGLYRFTRYKTSGEDAAGENAAGEDEEYPSSFEIAFASPEDEEEARRGVNVGTKLAAATRLARDLANEPSNAATPEYLAQRAAEISERHGMEATILDRAGIETEGLIGLSTVGRSASNEPRFIVVEHRKGGDAAPVVLVGKAVTFDSGGISIKPSAGMEEMKFDMCGGAAVIGAMEFVGQLDLPLNVIALVPATENLPGGNAFKPGDVLRMRSGKTVEIVTTDAEGRLILADALTYAARYEPAAVIDCATLTGACVVALGHHATGLMGNDEDLICEVQAAGEITGERAWPLPLFEEYTEQIKGDTADIKNSGGRPGGALTAGAFLKEFAEYPWVHLDIAGTAYRGKGGAYATKGASGVPTRLLLEFLLNRSEVDA